MGFMFVVDEDPIRDIDSWCFAEKYRDITKWGKRLKEAHLEVADMFITKTPFFMASIDDNDRPSRGEIAPGTFFIEPSQFNFESNCFLANDSFLKTCSDHGNPYRIFSALGEMWQDTEMGVELLKKWQNTTSFHCLHVYKDI